MNRYRNAADLLDALPELVLAEKAVRGVGLRQISKETGVSLGHLSEFTHRITGMGTGNAAALLRWMAGEPYCRSGWVCHWSCGKHKGVEHDPEGPIAGDAHDGR